MAAGMKRKRAEVRTTRPAKKRTETEKNFRYESFNQRIARLHIDPVRRPQARILDDDDVSVSASYFKVCFDEWAEKNLSDNFVQFVRATSPLTDSLAQILHHKTRIVELLVEHIGKRDKESLQPLLDLVSQLSHDLGARFEEYVEQTVKAVTDIAATFPDAEVTEWSFNCLAWLFKYLSRLLVPDLRPIYRLVAPIMGKERQKPYVMRFAAEAMSFLIRKAAEKARRDTQPLKKIVKTVLTDLAEQQGTHMADSYRDAVIVLFDSALKSAKQGELHSSADILFKQLLDETLAEDTATTYASSAVIVKEVMIDLIHNTNAQTFRPILAILTQLDQGSEASLGSERSRSLATELLIIVAGMQEGRSIEDWSAITDFVKRAIVGAGQAEKSDEDSAYKPLELLAIIHQNCPLNNALGLMTLIEQLSTGAGQKGFVPFCVFHAELGQDRFSNMLLPVFQKFTIRNWQKNEDQLIAAIIRLQKAGVPTSKLIIPDAWKLSIESESRKLIKDKSAIPLSRISRANGLLRLVETTKADPVLVKQLIIILSPWLEDGLASTSGQTATEIDMFLAGQVFDFLARNKALAQIGRGGFSLVCRSNGAFGKMPLYWSSVLNCLRQGPDLNLDTDQSDAQSFMHALKVCLTSPSAALRLTALEILQIILRQASEAEKTLLDIALTIARTSPTLQNVRDLTMQLRRLGMAFDAGSSSIWLLHAIPAFCFGLMHVKLSQTWDDATAALKEMCNNTQAETIICDIGFEWLGRGSMGDTDAVAGHGSSDEENADESKCGCCRKWAVIEKTAADALTLAPNVETRLTEMFYEDHVRVPLRSPVDRSQALRILNGIPTSAERRSRHLVPILLDWAGTDNVDDTNEEPAGSEGSDDTLKVSAAGERWSRKDQKALLSLFSLFNNPKALYKTDEVYQALLGLLCHGDSMIQKSAFKAIQVWKDPILRRYDEDLRKFLDETRMKEQLTGFLAIGQGDSSLQEEHRSTVLPIVLRLLYGNAIIRGKGDQKVRRKAIFRLLTTLYPNEAQMFIDLVLGPLADLKLVWNGVLQQKQLQLDTDLLEPRKQFGMLNMLEDLLDTMKTTAAPLTSTLADPVLYCLFRAEKALQAVESGPDKDARQSLMKKIRGLALTCLNHLFRIAPTHNWLPYMPSLYSQVLNPKLDRFAAENSQGVSGLLRMFAAWAGDETSVLFFEIDRGDVLIKVVECLSQPASNETVRGFVLRDILTPLLDSALESTDKNPARALLVCNTRDIIQHLATTMRIDINRDLLEDLIATIVRFAELIDPESIELLQTAAFLLTQPAKRVPTKSKSDLLRISLRSIPHVTWTESLLEEVYPPLCTSFAFFPDKANRQLLCDNLRALAQRDQMSQEVAELCADLNSWSQRRLDEPDFERRSKAFYTINEQRYQSFTGNDWLPIVNNMMHLITDAEETAIRTSASHSLKRFVDAAAQVDGQEKTKFYMMLDKVVLDGIERGIKTSPELVRSEYLSVLGHAVQTLSESSRLAGMKALLGNDEESSFFVNIINIQQHRRLRALRRLVEIVEKGEVAANGLAHVVIPLLERSIFEPADGNLAAESSRAIASISAWIDWSQYRILLRRYTVMLKGDEAHQENVLRLLEGLSVTLEKAVTAKQGPVEVDSAVEVSSDENMNEVPAAILSTLAITLPKGEKLHQYLTSNALPPLSTYLHQKEDSFVSRRTAVATIVTRLIRLLPEQEFQFRFTGLLSDVCNILRSKNQDSRDMTRRAITNICLMVGPSSFGFVVKELRRVLIHGFYLHVLSFSIHSILEAVTPSFQSGDLDYCVNDIMSVVMEDIFGGVGQEKDADEYMKDKANKREVRGKKSFDTMQLLARTTSLHHLIQLIRPIESLLMENLNHKMINSIDELLRRVELGLLQNEIVKDRDILVFCYEVIQHAYTAASGAGKVAIDKEKTISHFVVRKVRKMANDGLEPIAKLGKIIRFSFEIVRNAFRKNKQLATPANIAGFMPIIGDAVVQDQEEIKMAAMRLFTAIVTIPLPRIEEDAPVYVAEAAKIIDEQQGANDEMGQACLKLISTVLRERKDVPVKDRTVAALLKRLKPDLQNLGQQGGAFTLLRSIIARKIVIPEVYELIDGDEGIASMSVRDHDRSTRDLARGVYFAFLMNYPQAKGRFAKQLGFLVRNLQYEHAEGRQSVMETVHLLLNKLGEDLVPQVVKELFWPLVAAMINDESKQCREMAASLVKSCFSRGDEEWTASFLSLFQKLMQEGSSALQKRTALHCWTLYLEDRGDDAELVEFVAQRLPALLTTSEESNEDEWQLIYWALHTFFVLCTSRPEVAFTASMIPLWTKVRDRLAYPHAWVKSESVKVIGLYLADIASANGADLSLANLKGSHGLTLDTTGMCRLTYSNLYLLRNAVSEDVAAQAVKNLAFLGRCFADSQAMWVAPPAKRNASGWVETNGEEQSEQSADNDDDDIEGEVKSTAKKDKTAIAHLVNTLAIILNQEPKRRPGTDTTTSLPMSRRSETLIPRMSSLRLLALLITTLSVQALAPTIDTILLPLVHLTDPNNPVPSSADSEYTENYNTLVTNATELMDVLQSKLGTTEYVSALQRVRGKMSTRREERRRKRKFEAVARPEIVERRKQRKGEREKVKRKAKGEFERGKRRGY